MSSKEKTSSLEFKWTWRSEMASIIRFLEMGNNDNKRYARERLMEIADKLDIKGDSAYVRVSQLKKQAIDKLIDNVDYSQVVDFL